MIIQTVKKADYRIYHELWLLSLKNSVFLLWWRCLETENRKYCRLQANRADYSQILILPDTIDFDLLAAKLSFKSFCGLSFLTGS